MYAIPVVLLSTLAAAFAAPTPPEQKRQTPFEITEQAPWNFGAVTQWQIHSSCNASERYQLSKGLEEAVELAGHAKDHINRWDNISKIFQKYFGNRPTFEAVSSFDVLVNGDRSGALFRCDDPDQNCANFADWAGHWRGNNASDETVICPLSFEISRPISAVCAMGFNVRQGSRTAFWGSDLMHRLFHIPSFGQGYVEHYAEDYDEIISAASMNSPNATKDSYCSIYFALEAWAHDIINPGAGCPGPVGELPEPSTSSAAASATSSASVMRTKSAVAATTASSSVAESCHTHSNGDVHCSEATATLSETASATATNTEASATESASGENCHTHANWELHCE